MTNISYSQPRKRGSTKFIVAIVVTVIAICAGVSVLAVAANQIAKQTTLPPAVTDTEPSPGKKSPKVTGVEAGSWTVGEDIPAGTYKVVEKADGTCYWARLKPNGDIIANNIGGGLPKITLKKGEVFETSNCPLWKKVG